MRKIEKEKEYQKALTEYHKSLELYHELRKQQQDMEKFYKSQKRLLAIAITIWGITTAMTIIYAFAKYLC